MRLGRPTAQPILTELNDVCLEVGHKKAQKAQKANFMCLLCFLWLGFLGFSLEELVGAADSQEFVGGSVDFGYGDFVDGGAENNPVLLADGRVTVRIGPVEKNDYGRSDRRGHMHRSRIVGNKERQPCLRRNQLAKSQP